jgi:hypothetical protein
MSRCVLALGVAGQLAVMIFIVLNNNNQQKHQ